LYVTAGLHDPRVTYWEPAKWVAKLRELKKNKNVILFRTNMESGHAGASGRWDLLKELAEEVALEVLACADPG
jgi:oligopeptidase B